MNYISLGSYYVNLDRVNCFYQVKQDNPKAAYLYIEFGDVRPLSIRDPEGKFYEAICRKAGVLPYEL